MTDEVDKLITEVERMYNEVTAMAGSPPSLGLDGVVEMLKNVRIRLFGPPQKGRSE